MASNEKAQVVFPVGDIVFSKKVSQLIVGNEVFADHVRNSILRHSQGDWGSILPQDKEANTIALQTGLRILSSYPLPPITQQEFLWVITDDERKKTRVCFRDEFGKIK